MPFHFTLSVRFLDPAFHGRRDGRRPEWPPSPLRAFQALVAAAAARRRTDVLAPTLQWLERHGSPILLAPASATTFGYRLSVPNNAMDIVASAWCRGNYSNSGVANPATHRTMKTVRPTRLLDGDTVHYLWQLADPLTDEVRGHVESLADIARSVVALGWGIDLVVSQGAILSDEEVAALPGERWMPGSAAEGVGLRVPVPGTLDDLIHRHERFLGRLGPDGFTPPPPLSIYATRQYLRAADPQPWPMASFSLLNLDASGFRAFDTVRRALTIAGMVRHATRLAAERAGWDEARINTFVLGHGESKSREGHVAVGSRRFVYMPLPSIEGRGDGKSCVVGSVRRVILSALAENCDAEIAWARRSLSGQELVDEGSKKPVALLSIIPTNEKIVRQYTQPASSWSTVTPMVLPGYDDPGHYRRRLNHGTSTEEQRRLLDGLSNRIDGLIRKAIKQAGFSQVLADHAEIEWRKSGFWPGVDLADRYGVPSHLRRYPRYHVRLKWRDEGGKPVQVPGPICIGGGRFFGLGLFVIDGKERGP
ncbi:MAG TPA: type I-U CRISPR-associated protein Csb2 [Myxococcota bacterium]|nr:type I-U CRISPR-associated protein Csb2 [Myxococcota bacterium]